MDPISLILLFIFSLVLGIPMGGTGIGGVLIVPDLIFVTKMDTQNAIASAMFAYIFAGLAATLAYSRRGSIKWPIALKVCVAAAPAAFLGAITVWSMPGEVLLTGIAVLTLFSAFKILRPTKGVKSNNENIPPYALVAVGGISGFFSALAGAGGAIIAIPLLLAMGYPALQAIGISQATVLVIAITATVGNLSVGQIELIAGSVIAVALVVGILIGTRVAHALPINTLRNIVACVLVLVAISIAFQIARGTLTL